ncbi:MAG TPA: thermonuclease family protein [Methanothrix sp.]|nr:thermonuclease family protein [Methanothrix sp.]HPT19818.1 thermonuclease family protein [Methanothrix sp.]
MTSIADGERIADGSGRKAQALLFPGFCILIGLIISVLLLSGACRAAMDESWGTVTNVVDGDTFDVTIEKASDKVTYSVERVRLADIDSPEMDAEAGPAARDFTYAVLMNKRVFLDIDDRSSSGRDDYGRLICLAYISGFYGQPIPSPCVNRLLVDAGHARINDFSDNEFKPQKWWSEGDVASGQASGQAYGKAYGSADAKDSQDQENQSQESQSQGQEANGSLDLGQELKETLEKDLLPKIQDSAEEELDRMERDGWSWLKKQIGLNSSK